MNPEPIIDGKEVKEMKKLLKQWICIFLVMFSLFTPVTSVLPGASVWGTGVTAEAASKKTLKTTIYFKKYTGNSTVLSVALQQIGAPVFLTNSAGLKYIASKNGISNYTGTNSQNTKLLNLLKKGKLKDSLEIDYQTTSVSLRRNQCTSITLWTRGFYYGVLYQPGNTSAYSVQYVSGGGYALQTQTSYLRITGKKAGTGKITFRLKATGQSCCYSTSKALTINVRVTN